MELKDAIDLLHHADKGITGSGHWLELGAGRELFTQALAHCLSPGSLITAVDTDKNGLAAIPDTIGEVAVEKIAGDFSEILFPAKQLDGLLMANSLHYIADHHRFLRSMQPALKKQAAICLVEYDTTQANRWVPYPLSGSAAEQLLRGLGWVQIQFVQRKPSIFQHADIYSVLATAG